MEKSSQNIYWMLVDLRQPKLQKRSPCNWIKTKEKKKIRACPVSLGRSCERGKVPLPWEALSVMKRAANRKRASKAQRNTQQMVCSQQNTESPAQTADTTSLPFQDPHPLCVQGPGTETWASEETLRGLASATWRQPGGAEPKGIHRRSLGPAQK